MEKDNYTNIDNEVKTNIDNEVKIHPAFIRFVLSRPWMRDVDYYKEIRSYEKKARMKWLFDNENNKDRWCQTVGNYTKAFEAI